MQPFQDKLEALKKMLASEDDFKATFTYFFDHLGEDRYFIESGKKVKHPFLKDILKVLGQQLFNDDGMVTNLKLLKLPKTRFYHGSCFIHGRMATLFFFEDIEMGMAAIHFSETHEVKFARFTGTLIEGDKVVIMPDGAKKTIH